MIEEMVGVAQSLPRGSIADPAKRRELNLGAFDDEIMRMERSIIKLKLQRNDFVPVHTLPNELFGGIFFLLNSDDEIDVVTAVCSRWRAVALGIATLWGTINFGKPQ